MFFKRTSKPQELKLSDIAKKVLHTGYVFDEINGDLGAASDEIMKNSNRIIMAYGYARRAAVAGLYLQGLFKKEDYDYVHSIFKSLQISTEHSIEFQEQAYADAIAFMQTYHHVITSFFVNTMVSIAQDYEVPQGYLDDEGLIKAVLDFAHQEEESIQIANEYEIHRNISATLFEHGTPTIHAVQNRAESHNVNRTSEITSILTELSGHDSKKSVTMWITPLEEAWSCEFHFSPEELDIAYKLTEELYTLMEGKVQMPTFPYRAK